MREHKFGGTFVLQGDPEMHIGSLLFYKRSDSALKFRLTQLDYGFILQYELLRVLDLGNIGVESGTNTSDLVNIAKLVHLSSSATVSVQQILEEQRDMSNNQLNVNIVGMVQSRSCADSVRALSIQS
ncbi:hypothetical protein ACH5RR_034501 [Cinchona calisaya]|uniref:Uncharacterized protein n=1 Tax=Cinchona calisaya TaxID=153742 RepID=A0ABD2YEQ1_9GENT